MPESSPAASAAEFKLTAAEAVSRGLAGAVPRLERVTFEPGPGRSADAVRHTDSAPSDSATSAATTLPVATELSTATALPAVTRTPRAPALSAVGAPRTGHTISAVKWGSVPADTIVLHGAALNAHTWDATLLYWGRPALVFDLPGHGESAWRDDADYSPATLADALARTIDQARERGLLADGPLAVVGHSLGGLTALALAGLRDDIAHVVALDALPAVRRPERASAAGPTGATGPAPTAASAPTADSAPTAASPPAAGSAPTAGPTADGSSDPLDTFLEQFEQLVSGPADYDSREQIVQQATALGFGGPALESVRRGVIHNTRVRPDGRVEWKHHISRLAPHQAAKLVSDPQPLWDVIAHSDARVDLVRAVAGIVTGPQVDRLLAARPQARIIETDTGHNIHEEQPEALARILDQLV